MSNARWYVALRMYRGHAISYMLVVRCYKLFKYFLFGLNDMKPIVAYQENQKRLLS